MVKKKEELQGDLTLESFRKPEIKWEPKWMIKAGVIDTPAITRRSGPAPPSCCCCPYGYVFAGV